MAPVELPGGLTAAYATSGPGAASLGRWSPKSRGGSAAGS